MKLKTIADIKSWIAIEEFLHRLGYEPARRGHRRYDYISMIRSTERTPSFCVDLKKQRWDDYGTVPHKGGDVIDLAMEIFGTQSIRDAMNQIRRLYGENEVPEKPTFEPRAVIETSPHTVSRIAPLESRPALCRYLESRGVCMKLLIDNNLSHKLVGDFSSNFSDSAHVRTVLSVRADDAKIWRYAGRNGFVTLTKDNDFDEFTHLFGCPPKVVHLVCGNKTTSFVADLVLLHKKEIIDFGTSDPENCLLKIVG